MMFPSRWGGVIPRSPPLVLGAVLATLGLYAPMWAGLTWRELRDVRPSGTESAIWHGVALCIPVLGIFRIVARGRLTNELLRHSGSGARLNVLLLAIGSTAAWLLVSPASVPLVDRLVLSGFSVGRAGILVYGCALVLVAGMVAHLQFGLDQAWKAKDRELVPTFGAIEVVAVLIAVLFWAWRLVAWLANSANA